MRNKGGSPNSSKRLKRGIRSIKYRFSRDDHGKLHSFRDVLNTGFEKCERKVRNHYLSHNRFPGRDWSDSKVFVGNAKQARGRRSRFLDRFAEDIEASRDFPRCAAQLAMDLKERVYQPSEPLIYECAMRELVCAYLLGKRSRRNRSRKIDCSQIRLDGLNQELVKSSSPRDWAIMEIFRTQLIQSKSDEYADD